MLPPVHDLITEAPQTRQAIVAVLAWVMGADGELRPEERRAVADMARRLDLPVPDTDHAPSWSESWAAQLTPIGGSVLLLAALLATADGDLSPPEEQCLALLADALDLAPSAVPAVIARAEQGHRWMNQGLALGSDARRGGYAPA